MEILSLYPSVKETIWGGKTLIEDFGFETDGDNVAEAWLLSCHKDGPSYVLNGEYKGLTLAEVIEKDGGKCLGTNNAGKKTCPILIKLIDARDKLSVQVHPGDAYAIENENENGKTEAWYLLKCDKNSSLIYGVNHKMSPKSFEESVKNGTLLKDVNIVKVKSGDVVYIPSGMLHAIGEGILLAEVQQSSNTTYRVFDYNRKDKDGNARRLDIKKAVDVVNLEPPDIDFKPRGKSEKLGGAVKRYLTGCEYFKMASIELDGEYKDISDVTSFVSLLTLYGNGIISSRGEELEIKMGSSLFIPASYGEYKVKGKASLLETRT